MTKKVEQEDGSNMQLAVIGMLIGVRGMGVNIHILKFLPTSFFSIMKFRLIKRNSVPNMGPKDVFLLGYSKMRKDVGKMLRQRWT